MSADTTVSATFNPIPVRTLNVTVSGTATGTVTSTPTGISCGATCSAQFPNATQITLMATPAPHAALTGWSGAGCSGTSTCNFTISADTNVTATFAPLIRTLT